MEVEIIGSKIDSREGIIYIYCLNQEILEEERWNRERTDEEREITFVFDVSDIKDSPSDYRYLYRFLKSQKAVKALGSSTWGQALEALTGTITQISKRYLVIE